MTPLPIRPRPGDGSAKRRRWRPQRGAPTASLPGDHEKTTCLGGSPPRSRSRFLVGIGEQLQESDELTITGDEWKLPFSFGEPVELEVEYEGYGEQELEIEVEIPGRTDETAPSVE
jgi:amphi-Trp domain-containing protein